MKRTLSRVCLGEARITRAIVGELVQTSTFRSLASLFARVPRLGIVQQELTVGLSCVAAAVHGVQAMMRERQHARNADRDLVASPSKR